MAKITAQVSKRTPGGMLLVEASDGQTYIRDSQTFRGKVQHTFSAMPTVVDRSKPLADNLDRPIAWGKMPQAVRDLMRE